MLRVARDDGMTGPVELTPPQDTTSARTVAGVDNTWPVNLDRLAVDPATSTIVARSDFADWPLLAQLSKLGVQAHMGVLFGLAAPPDPHRPAGTHRHSAGPWHLLGLPAWMIVVGVPVVFAIGWALPLFGIPLAVFLIVDAVVGGIRTRRRTAVPTSPAPAGR